jgi:MerR family transcriptional regulator/heat shock protein HspR
MTFDGPASTRLDEPSLPMFTVSQVADVLGVQQAFLRRLDTQDLVRPARSEGRQRRYSRDDITRIESVLELIGDGLTLNGVRRVLELQAEVRELRREIRQLRDQ